MAIGAIQNWIPARNWGFAQGFPITGGWLGSAITPPMLSALLLYFGWREALAAVCIPSMLLLVWWQYDARDRPAEHPAVGAEELADLTEDTGGQLSDSLILRFGARWGTRILSIIALPCAAARAYGSHVFPADELHESGWEPVLETIPKGSAVYVTIDADGMDPTEMPGVMAPSPGGILYREIAPVLRRIARNHRVVGMDVVEIAPSYDSANGITAIMAGRLLVNVLGASWAPEGAMRRR